MDFFTIFNYDENFHTIIVLFSIRLNNSLLLEIIQYWMNVFLYHMHSDVSSKFETSATQWNATSDEVDFVHYFHTGRYFIQYTHILYVVWIALIEGYCVFDSKQVLLLLLLKTNIYISCIISKSTFFDINLFYLFYD